ncbi:MAG TPA: DUF4835 family protein [Bacteroidia bacterium]|nr:DUF4835 family protein [Bacteroidia bacterium]
MKKLVAIFVVACAFITESFGQELNCQVQVVSPQIQGTTEKRIFDNLQKAVFEFLNNTKWTTDIFSIEERISCSMFINITEKLSTDEYKATVQIQSTRAVYKSSYNTVLLNHNDADFQFRYVEFQPLDFSMNTFNSNLTSVMAFYAYTIIAMDYDSYSLNGGTPWWQKAQTIVSNAQNAIEKGWKSMESTKNRYWLVENMLQPTFVPMRECMYKYHRLGFDLMYSDVAAGRAVVLEALQGLEAIHNQRPLSFPMQMFFNAKSDEIVKLFTGGLQEEKAKVVPLLQKIDPGHGIVYQNINRAQ